MTVQILAIKPQQIDALWGAIYPYLKPAIDEDFSTDETMLKTMLLADKALLWVGLVDNVIKGGCVTIVQAEREKWVNIVTLGGEDFKDWKDALNDALTMYAESLSCQRIIALGRDAWQKLWPDFTPGLRLYSKEI